MTLYLDSTCTRTCGQRIDANPSSSSSLRSRGLAPELGGAVLLLRPPELKFLMLCWLPPNRDLSVCILDWRLLSTLTSLDTGDSFIDGDEFADVSVWGRGGIVSLLLLRARVD